MRMHLSWGLSVLLLAGCAKAGQPALPQMKQGLWEITRTTDKHPKPHVMRVCMDAAQQRKMNNLAAGLDGAMHCTGPGLRHVAGDRYTYDATCPMGAKGHMTVHSDQQISSTHTRNTTRSTYDPPVYGMHESSVVVEGRWVSASCAGATPGFGAGQ